MSAYNLLLVLGCGLAFLGYVTCLVWARWITLAVSGALALWMWQDQPPTTQTALYWVGALALVLIALWVARPFWTTRTRTKSDTATPDTNGIVIDGTNVLFWEGEAELGTLQKVVTHLKAKDMHPTVFLDASSRHHLKDKSLDERGFAKALGLPRKNVMVCPAGTEADAFILKFAKENRLPVVSNDRFGDRLEQTKGLKLIKGGFAGQKPQFHGL